MKQETEKILEGLRMRDILDYVEGQGYTIRHGDPTPEDTADEASRLLYWCSEAGVLKTALCDFLGICDTCSADVVSELIYDKIE